MAENENVTTTETTTPEVEAEATPEVDERDKEILKLRKRLSEVNSESANYKRQLREKQSADEKAEADRAEAQAKMEQELKELRRDKTISDYKARFIGLGYADDDAVKSANALADGDVDTVFSTFKSHLENTKKSVTVEAMDRQNGLSVGNPPSQDELKKKSLNSIREAAGLSLI